MMDASPSFYMPSEPILYTYQQSTVVESTTSQLIFDHSSTDLLDIDLYNTIPSHSHLETTSLHDLYASHSSKQFHSQASPNEFNILYDASLDLMQIFTKCKC